MKEITAYVHTHWDREWYREFEEFRLRLIEVFDEIIGMLEKGELPCFYFDGQTAALEDYLEIFPEKTEKITKLIKEKKIRTGPFYCSADSFLVSGESIYSNLEFGIRQSIKWGETEFLGYLSDTFGHSKSIPSILKSFKIDKACLWRGLGDLPADLDWDGIKVTYLIQGYFQDFLSCKLDMPKKAEALKKYIDKIAVKSSDNILLPIGADHLAAPKNLKSQINKLNKIYKNYNLSILSPFEYFDKIKKRKKVTGEFLDNKLNFLLPGVYSSRIYLKQKNAQVQYLTINKAQTLQALMNFGFKTKNRQKEIDYALKTMLKNHAHDGIYGCGTDNVHREIMQRYENTQTVSNGIIKRTLRDISSDNGKLTVINLSQYPYSGKIKFKTEKPLPDFVNAVKISSEKGFTDKKLYNIDEIPVTEDITDINEYLIDVKNLPPFSITKIKKENVNLETTLKASDKSIENKFIKLEVKNDKITVTDKKRNEKYSDFINIFDRADTGDSYNFGPLKNDRAISSKITKTKLTELNSIRAVLNLQTEIRVPATSTPKGRSKKTYKNIININAILYNQAEFIEFKANWNNKSKNHILQVEFNLKNKIYETTSEDLYGTVKRKFNPDYDIYKDIPAPTGKEIKPNTAPMQRFVQSENFALFTEGLNEYEINKNKINLTILRATGIISNPKNTSRGTPAGPPLLTPDLQCLGESTARFAFAFETNVNDLFRLADEFYEPYFTVFADKPDTSFFDFSNENIKVYAFKTLNGGLLARLFNTSDKPETFESKNNTPFMLYDVRNDSLGGKTLKTVLNPDEIKNIVIKK